jgi:hypothetical protein
MTTKTEVVRKIKWDFNSSINELEISNPAGVIRMPLDRLSESVAKQGLAFGIVRKVMNEAALSHGPDGRAATDAAKFDAMRVEAERLLSGTNDWNEQGARAARVAGQDMELLIAAFMELRGCERAQAAAWAKAKSPSERAALMLNPKIKVIADRMREQLGKDIDSDALLDEALEE